MKVGWDWAANSHHVTVIDESGAVVDAFAVDHSEVGLSEGLERLRGLDDAGKLPVAIERPEGIVVERLLRAGHPVVPIHPNSFNAARPRWGPSRARSDPGDSYRLADFLRTDGHRFRVLKPVSCHHRHLQACAGTGTSRCCQSGGHQPVDRTAARSLAWCGQDFRSARLER
jgi:transposase